MARGRKTGGRRPGTPNKATAETRRALAEFVDQAAQALGPDMFDGDAHALLQLVYRNTNLPLPMRVDAAKAAVRYERPALMASHVAVDDRSKGEPGYVVILPSNQRDELPPIADGSWPEDTETPPDGRV